MIGSTLTFEPTTHQYREDGKLLPSVTQVLQWAGYFNPRFFQAAASRRGTLVHEATAELDRGDSRLNDFNRSKLGGFLLAWELWKRKVKPEMMAVEKIVGGLEVGCAGTVDRLVRIDGMVYVVDLKTGNPAAWHRLQLAGYCHCLQESYRRMTVYLNAIGQFRFKVFEDSREVVEFREALRMVQSWQAA